MQIWRFINDQHQLGASMVENYNPILVALSVLVASMGAYTALAVVDRIRVTAQRWLKITWLLSGATAFGFGVWGMHFVGMLAFNLSIQVSYELSLTLISILPAIFGSGIALYVMSRKSIRRWHLQLGSLLMALGIGTMHYTGMEAMQLNASMHYDLTLFLLSILAAHVLSYLALYIQFYGENKLHNNNVLRRFGSAIAMGIAVSVMHYIAMGAAKFFPAPFLKIDAMVLPPTALSIFVVIITTLIFGLAILGTIVDRRLTEANRSVRNSESFSRLLLESAGEGICGIDNEGNITFANLVAAAMLGYDAAELIGISFEHITGNPICNSTQLWKDELENNLVDNKSKYSKSTTFIQKNGTGISVEFTSTCIKENDIEFGFVLTFRDITDRLQAEADIRESEEKFRQIIEQAQEVLCLISPDGEQIIYISPAYENIWKCSCESLYEDPLSWMRAISPDDKKRAKDNFFSKAKQGIEYTEEFRIIRPDDSVCWLLNHCFPIYDQAGNLKHIAWLVRDINRRKLMENELRLAQKLEAVGQLAAGVAHEINTPVQFVGDNIDFLEQILSQMLLVTKHSEALCEAVSLGQPTTDLVQKLQASLEEAELSYIMDEAPKAIAQTKEGIQHISRIVGAMKAFSHPGGDLMEHADINAIIKNTVLVSRNEWKYIAEMVVNLDESIATVPCYSQAISQVILNLIVNAAHAIKELQGESSDKTGTITITTVEHHGVVQICIADTGSGIPDAIREKIFDPFYTTKAVGVGTGQGLSMARSTIVDGHNGTLDFESSAATGTKFYIGLKTEPAKQIKENTEVLV